MVQKPNFFIIGTHKAGTSALRYILKEHPDIYFPDLIEMHHFESDLHKDYLLNKTFLTDALIKKKNFRRKDYLEHYNVSKRYKILGDKTPSYLVSSTSAAEIYEFNKDAKIIAIFRDPVEYIYSLHSQNLFNLYENVSNFRKALDLESIRKEGKRMSKEGARHKFMLMYKERAQYTTQFDRFVRVFPKKNIKCIIFEDFKSSNKKVIREIEQFLELDQFDSYKFEKVNTNKVRRLVTVKKIIRFLSNTGLPRILLPEALYKKLAVAFSDFTTKKTKRQSIEDDLYQELKKDFLPEVEEFSNYLKSNNFMNNKYNLLEKWNYNKHILQ